MTVSTPTSALQFHSLPIQLSFHTGAAAKWTFHYCQSPRSRFLHRDRPSSQSASAMSLPIYSNTRQPDRYPREEQPIRYASVPHDPPYLAIILPLPTQLLRSRVRRAQSWIETLREVLVLSLLESLISHSPQRLMDRAWSKRSLLLLAVFRAGM